MTNRRATRRSNRSKSQPAAQGPNQPMVAFCEDLEIRQLLSTIVGGSGLSTTFTATAGDTLTFHYDLITSAKSQPGGVQSFAYYTLNGNAYLVAAQGQATNPSGDIFSNGVQTGNPAGLTGYANGDPYALQTTVPVAATGTNTIGIGIASLDPTGSGVLILDDIELVHNGVSTVISSPGLQTGDFEPVAGPDFSGFSTIGAASLQFLNTLGSLPAYKNSQYASIGYFSGSTINSTTNATPDIYALATTTGTTLTSLQALSDQVNPSPTGPLNLAAKAVSSGEIDLSWQDTATNAAGYSVQREPGTSGPWTTIASNLPANATSYADVGLTAGTQYTYRVQAFNAAGNSDFAGPQSATTLATPVITVTDNGGLYNGRPYAATGTVTAGTVNLGSPTFTYYLASDTAQAHPLPSAPSTVGNYLVVASYAGNGTYASASASTSFSITAASPVITITDAGGTYNGKPFPATASIRSVVPVPVGIAANSIDLSSASGVIGTTGVIGTSLEGVPLVVTYYTGTTATGNGSSTAPKNAGTYTAVATFAGSADYSAGSASVTFTIAKAKLLVTATSVSIRYGASLPALTSSITGFVPGDTSAVVTGSAALSTTALPGSPVGSYPITASVGTMAAANYIFGFVPGTLSITAASTVLTLTSNAPGGSSVGQPVQFTATVAAANAGSGVSSGKVQFSIDGVAFGAAVAVDSTGVASISDSVLTPGSHTITASFISTTPNYGNSSATIKQNVGKFSAVLTNLLAPNFVLDTPTITLGGKVASSVSSTMSSTVTGGPIPTGTVTITASLGQGFTDPELNSIPGSYLGGNSPNGTQTRTVPINPDGSFSAQFISLFALVGQYKVSYSYSGDANYAPATGSAWGVVSFGVQQTSPGTATAKAGSPLSLSMKLVDAYGWNYSSASVGVTAIGIAAAGSTTITPLPSSAAAFTYAGGKYSLTLNTSGMTAGTYSLFFLAAGDPVQHALQFTLT